MVQNPRDRAGSLTFIYLPLCHPCATSYSSQETQRRRPCVPILEPHASEEAETENLLL